MRKNIKEPIDVQEICKMIAACENEEDLDEILDLIDHLGEFNKISASQYMYLVDQFDEKMEDMALM